MEPDPPFVYGFNNPEHSLRLFRQTKRGIDAASLHGAPNMIVFTGYAARDSKNPNSALIPPEEGAANCIPGLKELAPYAESKNVTLCPEPPNTRDASHPMKGHPGYQGDHADDCAKILKAIDSSRHAGPRRHRLPRLCRTRVHPDPRSLRLTQGGRRLLPLRMNKGLKLTIPDAFFASLDPARHRLGLFEYLHDVSYFAKDRSCRFVAANGALIRMLGFREASEVIGKTDHQIIAHYLADDSARTTTA